MDDSVNVKCWDLARFCLLRVLSVFPRRPSRRLCRLFLGVVLRCRAEDTPFHRGPQGRGDTYDRIGGDSATQLKSFFSTLKYELVYHHRFNSLIQARSAIFDYIEAFYNRRRLHSSLAYQT